MVGDFERWPMLPVRKTHAEVYTSGGIDFAKEQILFASIPNMRFEKLEG